MTVANDKRNLLVERRDGVLFVTFNRPQVRNAMSLALLGELSAAFDTVADDRSVRAIVLRGAGGHFCAGGDIADMAQARQAQTVDGVDPVAQFSRQFGTLLRKVNAAPQATLAILEGAVLGGGFGLACVTDVAIALADAKFGLPETGLGLPPAQIAPFVVERIGLTQARRLGVCGGRFDGRQALALGLVHFVADDAASLEARVVEVLQQIRRCAPGANAVTKALMLDVARLDRDELLDLAATEFAAAVRGPEGTEGTMAFMQKRRPAWAEQGN